MSEQRTIACGEHGASPPAFLCGHLFDSVSPVGVVTSTDAVEPGDRPGAWCESCDAALVQQGEWNDESERDLDLRAVCVRCWDDIVARNQR
ncbi:hypothetical protein [Modestobacter versicolor]|uniref:Uncharacterized protein n=1 Tax=Modestobacter versicolor TaxID=429133 RepID=A0A323V489_9ACTN|nr:hypothetical protein [Modestobacter versicolor]MBB3674275.1 hypothetical protein [Modestobacter versicolor]MBB3678264.1 hypothetical protein [Modestobacter versicolor]PZA19331.1 hypothetical protein DMO24_21330 [Modestobacter versicolor]